MSTNLTPPVPPTVEMAVRAWHAVSDHILDGVGLDQPGCDCRNYGSYVRRVVEVFTGPPIPEPTGIGAVVVNPFTGKVYVRDAHPNLPWHKPDENAPEQWSDPTCEDWFTWDALPKPIVMQSPGWLPPPPPGRVQHPLQHSEPTGIGAVVSDVTGDPRVRLHHGERRWLRAYPDTNGYETATNWEDLAHPVTIRTLGWERS